MNRTPVIDADGHVEEPPVLEQFIELLERPYRDRARPSPDSPNVLLIDGEIWPPRRRDTVSLVVRGKEPLGAWHHDPARRGMWEPEQRLRDMDLEGIDIAVLFPGPLGLAAPVHPDPEMAIALVKGYNDWLAGYCRQYPDRLKGVAALPAHDIDASIEELRRCVTELGFVGAFIANRAPHVERNLDDPAYDPLWDALQGLDVALCIHNNAFQMAMVERFTSYVDGQAFHSYLSNKPIHDPTENMLAAQALIFGRVLDRFPRLRVGLMEAGAGWTPYWMDRLGEYYEEFLEGQFDRGAPAEYFKSEQCFVACEPDESTIGYVAQVIGSDRLIYASDYLHHDCKFPNTVKLISEREDLSSEAKAKILGGNAAVLYRLDAAQAPTA